MFPIDPSGEVVATVTNLDAELSMVNLDCSADAGSCQAVNLYNAGSFIYGTIDASMVSSTGLKTGTLSVVWTPAG
jgi:hypothetical protein